MDKLFLLPSNFEDKSEGNNGAKFFCSDCAMVLGFLSYFPEVKKQVAIEEVPFERPRKAVVNVLGEEHQSCPVLVLDDAELDLFPGIIIHQEGNKHFINDPKHITHYLADKHKVSLPH